MNKKYATIEDLNALKVQVNETNTLLRSLIEAQSNKPSASGKSKSQPKAGTSSKAPAKSQPKADKGEFDRSLYEATAKKLGCFNHGKVVATVENGKVIRHASDNRNLVYEAMGLSK